jgi:hypothetical protein
VFEALVIVGGTNREPAPLREAEINERRPEFR